MNKFYIEMRKDVFDTKLKNKRFSESDFDYIYFMNCYGVDTVALIASANTIPLLRVLYAADLVVDIDAMSYLKLLYISCETYKKYQDVENIPVHPHTISHIKRIVEQHAN